jgi:hypothetical protein
VIAKTTVATQGAQLVSLPQSRARFLRISGASYLVDDGSIPVGLIEPDYWQAHDKLIAEAAPADLALAELVLL